MLNRFSSACLTAILLSAMVPPVSVRAITPATAPQQIAQANNASCNAEQTVMLEILLFRSGYGSYSQPTPEQQVLESAALQQQLRFIAQLPRGTSQINALSNLVSRLYTLGMVPDGDADGQARLQPVVTQTAEMVTRIGSERSLTKAELLTQLGRSAYGLGQADQAKGLLRQARQTVGTIQGADFKAQALMMIAEAQMQVGDREAAIATLDEAISIAQRVNPTSDYPSKRDDLLSRAVTLYSQANAFGPAIRVAGTMQDPALQGYAQLALVQALLENDQLDSALQVSRTIRPVDRKILSLSAIANYYGTQGQSAKATETFNAAFALAQQQPNRDSNFSTGMVSAQVLQDYGKWQPEAAVALISSLPNASSRALVLISIATTYSQRNQMDRANALLAEAIPLVQQMTVEQHRLVTYNLTGLLLEAKRYDWALQLANLIPLSDEAGNLREAMLNTIIYTALGEGQLDLALQGVAQLPPEAVDRNRWLHESIAVALQQGQVDRADQIAQTQFDAKSVVEWVKAESAIAQHEHNTGNTQAAKTRLERTTQRVNGLTDPLLKGSGLVTLTVAYHQMGEADQATQRFAEVLRLAEATNATPNTQPAFVVGSTQPLVDAGLSDWAYQLAQMVPTYELQTPETITVMQAIFNRQDFALAETLIPTTRIPENKTQLLTALAEHYMALDQRDQAIATLGKAVAAARTIPNPEVRQTMVMGAGAYDYNDFTDRASQLEVIAQRYAYLNQMDQATQTLNLIQAADLRRQLSQRLRCYRAAG